jgi:beta-phosphoglucomutase-like phosphatase (HAD superfamily)
MRAIRAIGFDLEGPLLDLEQYHFSAHVEAAKVVLGASISYEWIIENIPNAVGGGDGLIAKGVTRHFDVPNLHNELHRRKRVLFEEFTSSTVINARPGSLDVIEWFVQNGYHIAIGSNTPESDAKRYIRDAGIGHFVPWASVVLAEMVGKPKPDPAIWLSTAMLSNTEPRHQLVIDDSPVGLEAAYEAGSPSIATPLHRSHSVHSDIARWSPHRIIADWREVNLDAMMSILDEELQR